MLWIVTTLAPAVCKSCSYLPAPPISCLKIPLYNSDPEILSLFMRNHSYEVMNNYTYGHIISDDSVFGSTKTFRYFEATSSTNGRNSSKSGSLRPEELGAWIAKSVGNSSRVYMNLLMIIGKRCYGYRRRAQISLSSAVSP